MKKVIGSKYGYLIIFALSLLQYANTWTHDYAWDDAIVITDNTRVQKGLTDIPELFENIRASKTEFRYGYRPVTLLTFATEVQLFGMNPHVSHFVNTALYAILCCFILFFLNLLFPRNKLSMFLVVALFAVHPTHTEVVANIKSRDEVLAMLFGIGALVCFYKSANKGSVLYLLASAMLMLLAFLSKESAVTIIGVMFILPLYFSKKIGTKQLLLLSGVVGILLVLLLLRAYVFSDNFFQSDKEEMVSKGVFHYDVFLGNPLVDVENKLQLLGNGFVLIFRYLKQFIYPLPLLHDYGFNQLKVAKLSSPNMWYSTVLVFAGLGWMIRELISRTPVGLGLAFFFINISIYLQLLAIAPDMYAERFLFVSSLGLSLVLIHTLKRIGRLKKHAPILGPIILIAFFAVSWNRNYAWKNNAALYEADIPHLQKCVRAVYNYAIFNHGNYYSAPESEKPELERKILENYEKTLDLTERLFIVYMDLGGAYMEFGYPEKALKTFENARDKFPHLSIPYIQIGKYHMSFGNYDKALPQFEKAIEIGEENPDFYYLLAICQFNTDNQEDAIKTLLAGEGYVPTSSAYYSLIARLYLKMQKREDAVAALERGLVAFPNDSGLLSALNTVQSL